MAVLFFSAKPYYLNAISVNSLKPIHHKKITESLQVPSNFPLTNLERPGKRVLPFTSGDCPGSLTIEAALSLSLFLLMASATLRPLLWMDRQRKVQTAAESVCGQLSQYAYIEKFLSGELGITEELEKEDNSLNGGGPGNGYFNKAAAGLWLLGKIQEEAQADSVQIRTAQVPDEEGNICFELEYRERVPFFPVSDREITMNAAVKKRAWIGLSGKVGKGTAAGWEDDDREEEIVYVGNNMSRFHWFLDCHYISNQYQSISSAQLKEEKNIFGRKYTACASCAKNGPTESTIYITSGGEHYHAVRDCPSMAAYVRTVPLKEVEHLGACSYCSRRKGGES